MLCAWVPEFDMMCHFFPELLLVWSNVARYIGIQFEQT
jgi:hypothetical protein